jgi:hypothetical protein
MEEIYNYEESVDFHGRYVPYNRTPYGTKQMLNLSSHSGEYECDAV